MAKKKEKRWIEREKEQAKRLLDEIESIRNEMRKLDEELQAEGIKAYVSRDRSSTKFLLSTWANNKEPMHLSHWMLMYDIRKVRDRLREMLQTVKRHLETGENKKLVSVEFRTLPDDVFVDE